MAAAQPLPETAPQPDQPPRLRLAPRPTAPPTFADAAYAATLALLLAAGIVAVLLLNTATQTQADRILLQKQQLAALAMQSQARQVALDRDAAPAVIAARAQALQLRPATRIAVVRASRRPTFAPPRPPRARSSAVSAHGRAARPVRAG